MRSRNSVVCLLVISSLCAAYAATAAAQSPTVQVSAARPREAAAGPGVPWTQVRFEFEGNRFFPSEQLRGAATHCYQRRSGEKDFDPELLDYCLRKDVLDVMRHTGYLRATLGEPRTARRGADVIVTVPVEERELYRLGRVKIEGAAHFDVKSLRELLPLRRSDIADSLAVGRWAFEHLKKKYADAGFIQYEADIEPEFRIEPGAGEGVVDLAVTVNEGRQFRLRKLEFKAEGYVPDDELRGAFSLKEGEVFRAQEFADGVLRMNDLKLFDLDGGRFEDVDRDKDVEFRADAETGDLEITIRLNEKGRAQPAHKQTPDAAEDEGRPERPTLKGRRPQTREE
jgi:hypothetical protein